MLCCVKSSVQYGCSHAAAEFGVVHPRIYRDYLTYYSVPVLVLSIFKSEERSVPFGDWPDGLVVRDPDC